MLNRLLQPKNQNRAAYVDSQGRISRTWVDTYAGVVVDVATTLEVPAIWRAVTMISDDVGSLPIHAYRGERRLRPTPRILERPNPFETPMETYSAMAAALLLHGNYIALKGPAGLSGYPDYLVPVDPAKVSIIAKDGRKYFRIDERTYNDEQVFHIKGFSLPGEIAGVGIVAAQRQGIGAAIAVMEYAARYFDGGAMPSYAIKSENPDLTQEEAELLKQKWMEHYGGRSRIPAVLNASTDIKELTANANDAQLVEARNQSILDAANIVGVPGAAVGAPNTSRTYTNTELQALEYIKTSLRPLTTRIEQAMRFARSRTGNPSTTTPMTSPASTTSRTTSRTTNSSPEIRPRRSVPPSTWRTSTHEPRNPLLRTRPRGPGRHRRPHDLWDLCPV
jgi:HK97 family phage portal protein